MVFADAAMTRGYDCTPKLPLVELSQTLFKTNMRVIIYIIIYKGVEEPSENDSGTDFAISTR